MQRGIKQFVYGLFYLLIATLVIWGVVSSFGESGGEPGQTGEEPDYFSVEVAQEPKFFQLDSGETSFLVKFGNPNKEAEVSFSYQFIVFGEGDKRIGEIEGGDLILPGREEFVVGFGDFEKTVEKVDVEIFDETGSPASGSFEEGVVLGDVTTEVGEEKVKIIGVLENKGILFLPEVKIIGILRDEFGFQLFTGSTAMDDVESSSERDFEIFIPADKRLKEKVDASSTRIFVNLE